MNLRRPMRPDEPDWTFLNDVLPDGIRPSDVDGMIERNGRFLVFEWKPEGYVFGRGSYGQRKALNRLGMLDPVTVVVVRGSAGPGTTVPVDFHVLPSWQPIPTDQARFRDFVKRWVE